MKKESDFILFNNIPEAANLSKEKKRKVVGISLCKRGEITKKSIKDQII